jgi:hypothetical protein
MRSLAGLADVGLEAAAGAVATTPIAPHQEYLAVLQAMRRRNAK